jgi:hypothetical protein
MGLILLGFLHVTAATSLAADDEGRVRLVGDGGHVDVTVQAREVAVRGVRDIVSDVRLVGAELVAADSSLVIGSKSSSSWAWAAMARMGRARSGSSHLGRDRG